LYHDLSERIKQKSSLAYGASATDQNHFASIYLDGKKIGQIHYMLRTNEKAMVELRNYPEVAPF
jgi:hypothetical protein